MVMEQRAAAPPLPLPRHHRGDPWGRVFSDHPFEPVLQRAEGVWLYDEDGKRYLDASGGPMAVNLGHGDPRIVAAAAEQMSRFSYCHPVLSNRPRANLAARVAAIAPDWIDAVYMVSGGSEAVETAIKIARQYHVATGAAEKHMVISHRDSYHGMTLGALSVSGIPGNRRQFEPMLQKWPKIPQYTRAGRAEGGSDRERALRFAEELEVAIHHTGAQQIAAFIATPVGCGSDYGEVAPREYWQAVREICDRHDVLLIADEVVTGFGRTGRWLAMQHFGVAPDLITMGKGISSLYAPLGAVAVSPRVNEPFAAGKAFVHGFTNMGHPVACAVGCAVIDVLLQDRLVEHAAEMGEYFASRAGRIREHPTVVDLRGVGLLRVGELVMDRATREFFPRESGAEQKLQAIALRNGLAFYGTLYGSRRVPGPRRGLPLFIAPPLVITREEIDELIDRLDVTLSEWESALGVA
ncbi:MAG TPA: aspartate aminotransferase family protein [Thermoanaerobaculia bacterium]|jgi:adenosylmethionine-8-amino-7-oxononanoate aminotransferase|nr:aspartate aminotransferase family protein [Thermoanaerobaculia bacterium]